MKTRTLANPLPRWLLLGAMLSLLVAAAAVAQVPVDDTGEPLGSATPLDDEQTELPPLSMQELEEIIGPVALYPDDLLAIVLPASTYPLEIVQAARFLDERENDSTLQPDESWDESVIALLNYPEVLRMMNAEIDWTWQLGEAVVAQQSDVIAAIEGFRDRAYAAGNLQSDEHQTVSRNDDEVIEIEPLEDDVIYVPYYEPEEVVVYQPRRVLAYYPRAYPVYYYPYPAGHRFLSDPFFGVTTAFRIGWTSNYLHVFHHSFHGHPFFGHNYYGNYWRRPSIHAFNNFYGHSGFQHRVDRFRHGSFWRPQHRGSVRPGFRQARSRFVSNRRSARSESGFANQRRRSDSGQRFTGSRAARDSRVQPGARVDRRRSARPAGDTPVRFRARNSRDDAGRGNAQRGGNGPRFAGNRDNPRRAQGVRRDANAGTESRRAQTTTTQSRSRFRASRNDSNRSTQPIANARQRGDTVARGNAQREPVAAQRRASPRTSTRRSSGQRRAVTQRRSEPTTTRRAQPQRRSQSTTARRAQPQRRSSNAPQRRSSRSQSVSRQSSRGPQRSSSSGRSNRSASNRSSRSQSASRSARSSSSKGRSSRRSSGSRNSGRRQRR